MVNSESFQPPVRSVRLSDQVAAQLQTLVTDNALKPGDKLPSERELCELLGVSRTVVRKEVRALLVKGLLDVRPGGGTEMRAPDAALVSDLMSVMSRPRRNRMDFPHALALPCPVAGQSPESNGAYGSLGSLAAWRSHRSAAALFSRRAKASIPPMWAWNRSTGSKLSRRTLASKLIPPGDSPPYFRIESMQVVVR